MSQLKCWKRNKETGYIARWDEKDDTGVVVVGEVHRVKSHKPFKFEEEPSFEAMYSGSVGGWHSIALKNKKDEAMKAAMNFMKDHNTC